MAKKASSKQRAHRQRFKVAVKYCKGSADFRECMRRQLKGKIK